MGRDTNIGQIGSAGLILILVFLVAAAFGLVAGMGGGLYLLAFVAVVVAVVLALVDFRFGLAMLILIFPFQDTALLPAFTGFNLVYYLSVVSFGSLLLENRLGGKLLAPLPRYVIWLFLIPVTLAWLNGVSHLKEIPPAFMELIKAEAFSTPKKYLAELLVKPFLFFLMAWMAGAAVLNSKEPKRFLALAVIAPVLPAIAMLVYLPMLGYSLTFLATPAARYVYSGFGLHTTSYGLLFASALTIQLFIFPEVRGWIRLGLALCMAIVTIALVLSFSRLGYLAALIAITYFVISQRRISYYVLAFTGTGALLLLFGDAIIQRVSTGVEGVFSSRYAPAAGMSGEELSAGRIYIWNNLLPEVMRSPIVGSGLGSTMWSEALKRGTIPASHPHSIYLGALLDMGVVGFSLLILFYAKVLRQFQTLASCAEISPIFRAAFKGGFVAFVGFVVTSFADNRYYPVREQTYIWLIFGIGLGYLRYCVPQSSKRGKGVLSTPLIGATRLMPAPQEPPAPAIQRGRQ
jgi:hypothetical protein